MKKRMAVLVVFVLMAAFFVARGECATNADFQVKKSVPQAALPREINIQVVKDSSVDLPDLTEEALAEIKTALAKQFTDEGWAVKEAPETPILTVAINEYQQGSKKAAVTSVLVLGFSTGQAKTKIGADVALKKGGEAILKAKVPLVAKEKESPIKDLVQVFVKTVVQGLNEFLSPSPSQK